MREKSNVVDINESEGGTDGFTRYEVLLDMYVAERRIVRERVAALEAQVDKLHNDFGDMLRMLLEFAGQEGINNDD